MEPLKEVHETQVEKLSRKKVKLNARLSPNITALIKLLFKQIGATTVSHIVQTTIIFLLDQLELLSYPCYVLEYIEYKKNLFS